MPSTPEQLEKRIAQLEARELTVRDLPMQALKNDLQDSWSVEGSRLVARRSIRPESLALTKTVGTMPAVGEHGQEVVYATSTSGVNWRFKYNAASASSYKWEFIGGAPIWAIVTTQQTTTSTSYTNLTTTGPQVTCPLAGDYFVHIGASIQATSGNAASMSYAIGASSAADAEAIYVYQSATTAIEASCFKENLKTGLAAATVLLTKYKTSAGTGFFKDRTISILPVRVSA